MMSEQMQMVDRNRNTLTAVARYGNWAVVSLIILFLVIYREVLEDLFRRWVADDLTGAYSHGLLVAIIVLYLLYKITLSHRKLFDIQPSIIGLILFIGSQSALLAVMLMEVSFMQHILFVVSLLAIIWTAYSYQAARLYVLPAILFSLTFPVWGDLTQYLQKVSIISTNFLLSLTGLPYYREQAFFHFPVGIIEIAPECAGLQQFLVSLIIGLLFSVQHRLRFSDLVKTLIYISIVSVMINTIRILIIMAVGYFTKMESSLVTKHILLGWIIYGVGIYLFLFFYSRKEFKLAPADQNAEPSTKTYSPIINWRYVFLPVMLVLVILPFGLVAAVTTRINARDLAPLKLAVTQANWHTQEDNWDISWRPAYPNSDVVLRRVYQHDGTRFYAYVLSYTRMDAAAKPLNMLNRAYDPIHWKLIKQSLVDITTPSDGQKKFRLDTVVSASGERLAVLSYYRVNGHVIDSLIKAKLAILSGLLHLQYRIDVVCLATRVSNPLSAQSGRSLVDFYHALNFHN